jgi:outer membrane lipoprotein SlyB
LSNGTVVSSFVSAEMQARIRLPAANTARLASAGRWIGRVSNVFSGAAGFASQWHQDAGLPTGDRVIRAATRGGLTVVGSVAGGAGAGVAAGAVCGPGAPVCSTVLGIGGALAGGILGDRAADLLPWMDSNEPLPGEHDLDEIRDGVAAEDASVDPALGATVDLVASDLALDATADDPYVHGRVVGLLPDRERLEFVIATGELPENVTPTGTTTTTTTTVPITVPVTVPAPGDAAATPPGTTTTTVPAPHAPAVTPDPWVEPRPYE